MYLFDLTSYNITSGTMKKVSEQKLCFLYCNFKQKPEFSSDNNLMSSTYLCDVMHFVNVGGNIQKPKHHSFTFYYCSLLDIGSWMSRLEQKLQTTHMFHSEMVNKIESWPK